PVLLNDLPPRGLVAIQAPLNQGLDRLWRFVRHRDGANADRRMIAGDIVDSRLGRPPVRANRCAYATRQPMSMTAGFSRTRSELVCDGVSLRAIADEVGTPAYVYSGATVRARYGEIDAAFGGYPHRVHYALKANSTLGIVTLLRSLGSAADA